MITEKDVALLYTAYRSKFSQLLQEFRDQVELMSRQEAESPAVTEMLELLGEHYFQDSIRVELAAEWAEETNANNLAIRRWMEGARGNLGTQCRSKAAHKASATHKGRRLV